MSSRSSSYSTTTSKFSTVTTSTTTSLSPPAKTKATIERSPPIPEKLPRHTRTRETLPSPPLSEPSTQKQHKYGSEARDRFTASREKRYAYTPPATLLQLLINEEYEGKKTRKQLNSVQKSRGTAEQLVEASKLSQTAIDAEHRASEAQHQASVYKLKLQHAEMEVTRAQEMLKNISLQRDDAELAAKKAREQARRMKQEKDVTLAREEGRRMGFDAGLERGRWLALNLSYEQPKMLEYPQMERKVVGDGEAYIEPVDDTTASGHHGRQSTYTRRTYDDTEPSKRGSGRRRHNSLDSSTPPQISRSRGLEAPQVERRKTMMSPPVRPPSSTAAHPRQRVHSARHHTAEAVYRHHTPEPTVSRSADGHKEREREREHGHRRSLPTQRRPSPERRTVSSKGKDMARQVDTPRTMPRPVIDTPRAMPQPIVDTPRAVPQPVIDLPYIPMPAPPPQQPDSPPPIPIPAPQPSLPTPPAEPAAPLPVPPPLPTAPIVETPASAAAAVARPPRSADSPASLSTIGISDHNNLLSFAPQTRGRQLSVIQEDDRSMLTETRTPTPQQPGNPMLTAVENWRTSAEFDEPPPPDSVLSTTTPTGSQFLHPASAASLRSGNSMESMVTTSSSTSGFQIEIQPPSHPNSPPHRYSSSSDVPQIAGLLSPRHANQPQQFFAPPDEPPVVPPRIASPSFGRPSVGVAREAPLSDFAQPPALTGNGLPEPVLRHPSPQPPPMMGMGRTTPTPFSYGAPSPAPAPTFSYGAPPAPTRQEEMLNPLPPGFVPQSVTPIMGNGSARLEDHPGPAPRQWPGVSGGQPIIPPQHGGGQGIGLQQRGRGSYIPQHSGGLNSTFPSFTFTKESPSTTSEESEGSRSPSPILVPGFRFSYAPSPSPAPPAFGGPVKSNATPGTGTSSGGFAAGVALPKSPSVGSGGGWGTPGASNGWGGTGTPGAGWGSGTPGDGNASWGASGAVPPPPTFGTPGSSSGGGWGSGTPGGGVNGTWGTPIPGGVMPFSPASYRSSEEEEEFDEETRANTAANAGRTPRLQVYS